LLDQARALEEQLANESTALTALAESAKAALSAEREASEVVQHRREAFALLAAARENAEQTHAKPKQAVAAAQAECTALEERLHVARKTLQAALATLPADTPAVQHAINAEELARAELDDAMRQLDERRNARKRVDEELQQMQAQITTAAGSGGLTSLAAKRVAERRIADALRRSV
jgi:chromosome segregation ATPase